MATFDVIDINRKKVGEIALADEVFAAEANPHLFYEVAKMQAINRRRGTVQVKNSSLVSGGGKKPWKQKGTGRARQGSTRASHWVGGGKAMGPKQRDYFYRPPRKVRRGAIAAALSLRAKEKGLFVLNELASDGKSKSMLAALTKNLKLSDALVVDAAANVKAHRSIRNLAKFDVVAPEGINLESILRHKHVVLTQKAAKAIETALTRTRTSAGEA